MKTFVTKLIYWNKMQIFNSVARGEGWLLQRGFQLSFSGARLDIKMVLIEIAIISRLCSKALRLDGRLSFHMSEFMLAVTQAVTACWIFCSSLWYTVCHLSQLAISWKGNGGRWTMWEEQSPQLSDRYNLRNLQLLVKKQACCCKIDFVNFPPLPLPLSAKHKVSCVCFMTLNRQLPGTPTECFVVQTAGIGDITFTGMMQYPWFLLSIDTGTPIKKLKR